MERLTFKVGAGPDGDRTLVVSRRGAAAPQRRDPAPRPSTRQRLASQVTALRERYDWDYVWMLGFTAMLFFRPQDHVPALEALHLAELTAIAGLAAMAVRRLNAGQTVAKINAEVIGIILLGAIILFSVPFSIWPGGAMQLFSDTYVKIILIFALMLSTLTSPRRLRQMTWLMLIASGYIAARAVADYARGLNLVEGTRVRGAVGGFFENPNDLALNLVTFLAPTIFIVLLDRKTSRRLFAAGLAVVMLAAIVFTKSRSGFVGLAVMSVVILYYTVRIRPAAIFGIIIALAIATPMMPASFWDRMGSITDPSTDPTGSRAARVQLFREGWAAFVAHPITGVGAGQFVNYDGPGRVERWRVTHNVWLQVGAELGIFGFALFAYLVYRGFHASLATQRALRSWGRRRPAWQSPAADTRAPAPADPFTDEERRILEINAKGMFAGMVGWFVCAFFASVAFNWTFYYLLALAVAGREVAQARRASAAAAAVPATRRPLAQVTA